MNVDYKSFTDAELAGKLNLSDDAAFREIYNRYWGFLYNHARRMLKDNEKAEDIVQDTFTTIYAQVGLIDYNKIALGPYLYTVVRNAVITLINREKLQFNYIASLQTYANAGEFITDNLIREKEIKRQIEQEIAELPPKMRAIFEMSRKAHLSHKEIAKAVKVSEGTVKKQLYYAIKILRSKLSSFLFFTVMYFILKINKML
jgi:RNA polymerase sigma-70 factor (ECF subfamily)